MGKINLPDTADQRIRDLEARVKELEQAAQTRVALDLIATAGVTIQDNGFLQVFDTAGDTQFILGYILPALASGAPQYGLILNRQNPDGSAGSQVMTLYNGDGVAPQTFGLYDAAGNNIWTDDATAGQGIGRPYIPIPMSSYAPASWQSTNVGAWTPLYAAVFAKQQPVVVAVGSAITPTGTNGQLRLRELNSDQVIGSVVTVTSAPGGINWTISGTLPGAHMDRREIVLEGQITSGTGSVSAQIGGCYGSQS